MSPAAVSSARSTWSCSSAANNDFDIFVAPCRAKQRHPIFTGPLMGDVLASQSPTRRTASTSGCRRVSSSTHRSATASVSASMAAPWIERRRRRVGRLHALPLDRRRFGRRACDCRFRREDSDAVERSWRLCRSMGSRRDHINTATSSTATQDSETESSALRIGLSRRRFSLALEPTCNSTACRRNSRGVGVTMTSCLSSRSSRQSARRSTSSVSP